jgi:hypothetical protein
MVSGFILHKYIKKVSRYEFLTADNLWIGSIWVEMCAHKVNVPDRILYIYNITYTHTNKQLQLLLYEYTWLKDRHATFLCASHRQHIYI